jgi:hypothetical protein
VFELNGEEYNVVSRILLPYEESAGSIESLPLIPDPNNDYEQTMMRCAFTSPARRP